jgi:hypothetical protein
VNPQHYSVYNLSIYPTHGLSDTWFIRHLVYPTPGLSNTWFIQHLVYPIPGLSDTFMGMIRCCRTNQIPLYVHAYFYTYFNIILCAYFVHFYSIICSVQEILIYVLWLRIFPNLLNILTLATFCIFGRDLIIQNLSLSTYVVAHGSPFCTKRVCTECASWTVWCQFYHWLIAKNTHSAPLLCTETAPQSLT